jgi:hypothetical protein
MCLSCFTCFKKPKYYEVYFNANSHICKDIIQAFGSFYPLFINENCVLFYSPNKHTAEKLIWTVKEYFSIKYGYDAIQATFKLGNKTKKEYQPLLD